jgi:hypothetical protein
MLGNRDRVAAGLRFVTARASSQVTVIRPAEPHGNLLSDRTAGFCLSALDPIISVLPVVPTAGGSWFSAGFPVSNSWAWRHGAAMRERRRDEPTASGGVSRWRQRSVSLASISRLTAAWSPQPAHAW